MARRKKEIDQKQFESLCALQCTREEILDFFDITEPTLNAWCKRTYGTNFLAVFRQKRGKGKISLRRHQMRLAEKNATMAIWLGKQYLGQRDDAGDDRIENKAQDDALSQSLRTLADEIDENNGQ